MNRYQYDNIDPRITAQQREHALMPRRSPIKRKKNKKSTGYDKVAGKQLDARRRAWVVTEIGKQPGSMKRKAL